MTENVVVREVGLRDGLQLVKKVLPTADKLAWIKAEAAAGVHEFEICSFVPPHVVPQFADARDIAQGAREIEGIHTQALMPNFKGGELGLAAGVQQMNYVISVSETHNQNNVRQSHEQSLESLASVIALRDEHYPGRRIGCGLATAFGCSFEGKVPHANVLKMVEKVRDIGVDEIMIPDTVGYAAPSDVRALLSAVLKETGDLNVCAHFHDTRGLGLANVTAALEAGVRRFDASLAGLGGCPFAPGATGNIVTEDLVFLLEAEGLKTGIDIMALEAARDLVDTWLADEPRHGNILRAGLPKGFRQQSALQAAE